MIAASKKYTPTFKPAFLAPSRFCLNLSSATSFPVPYPINPIRIIAKSTPAALTLVQFILP